MAENTRNQSKQGQGNQPGQSRMETDEDRRLREEQRVGGGPQGDRSQGQDRGRSRAPGTDDLEDVDPAGDDQAGIAGGGIDEDVSGRGGDRGGSGRSGGSR